MKYVLVYQHYPTLGMEKWMFYNTDIIGKDKNFLYNKNITFKDLKENKVKTYIRRPLKLYNKIRRSFIVDGLLLLKLNNYIKGINENEKVCFSIAKL